MLRLDLLRGGRVRFASSGKFVSMRSSVHPHRVLDQFVLLIGIDGKSRIRHDGREYVLEEGSYLLLFAGKKHGGIAPTEGKQSHFWCHFWVDSPVVTEEEGSGIAEYGRLPSNDKYRLLFSQLIDAEYGKYADEAVRRRVCDAYTEIILGELLSDTSLLLREETDKGKRLIANVKEWLRLHYRETIDLESAARAFGYHPDYLNSIFRKETGKTVCVYLRGVRIEKAKKLLLDTDLRVKEIAAAVGFRDEHYFMRAFHNAEGVTATEFRNTYFHLHHNTD
ncbi:MAG: helix-turn-helix transcriptional regulator [Clostridia bacterium]|nr:helix-turn-helix transcriptional regulator [Clostridia bacterium]